MSIANIKEVLQKLLPIFPFMAMSGVINNYFLSLCMILPLLIEFGEWVHEKLYATASSAHKITIYEKNYWKHRNDIYEIITFIIMRNKLIQNGQNFEIREYYQSKENFVMVGKHNPSKIFLSFPILTLSKGFSTPLVEKDFAVRITTEAMTVKEGEEENKAYAVTANTSQDIQKFLKYVETIQEDYLKEKYGKHLDDVSLLQYRKEKWVESPIAVKKTFDNTFLDPSIETSLIQQLDNFVAKRKSYLARGNAYKIGYLFYGLPGNGKSSTIFAIANRYNRNIYKLNLSKVASDEFDTQIHEIQPNSVVIIEDVDTISITNKRDEAQPKEDDFVSLLSSNKKTDLGKLLAVLDGYCELDGCIVIMTTNHPEKLDPALIRPGRIDHKIKFKNVSPDQIRRIYKFYFNEELVGNFKVDISVADFINTIVLPHEDSSDDVVNALRALTT